VFDVDLPAGPWFAQKMAATDLAKTGHQFLDKHMITAFMER
jgi:hypothetical protein